MQRHRNSKSTRRHSRRRASAAIGLLALALVSAPVIAQSEYPTRAITLIVPFAAGGPTDVVARIAAGDYRALLDRIKAGFASARTSYLAAMLSA